jgi:hypothetical protein
MILILGALILICTNYFFKLNENKNQIIDINLKDYPLNNGLNIITTSEEKGIIFGGYKDNNLYIYFIAQKLELNPLFERVLFDAPKYNIIACYTSSNGAAFNVQQYCPILDNSINDIDLNQRIKEFKLSFNIAKELQTTNLSKKLNDEKNALINLALSIKQEELIQDVN